MPTDEPRAAAPYRDMARTKRLTDPPRPVPLRLRLVLRFGGLVGLIGLARAVTSIAAPPPPERIP